MFAAVGREASFAAVTTAVYLLSADGVIESVNFGGEAPNTTIGLVLGQYGYVDEFQERLSFSAGNTGVSWGTVLMSSSNTWGLAAGA